MRLESFRGRTLPIAFEEVRRALGDDAMIVHSRLLHAGTTTEMEVIAVAPADIALFRRQLAPPAAVRLTPAAAKQKGRPQLIVAVVGPTGAGKTSTAVKLALLPQSFGARKVGLLTLEHYQSDCPELINRVADDARIPVEIVRETRALDGALRRLSSCEVIIADTPGQGPRRAGKNTMWRAVLNRLEPDEMHLVVPATMRLDLVPGVLSAFRQAGATHALITKLDEVPNDFNVAQLASMLTLPIRWVTDGQDAPADLHEARPRLISALGVAPAVTSAAVA